MQTFAAKIKALCRFAANAGARRTRQHNSYVLGLMLAFVALSAFVMLRPASAHEGEDHSSEAQGSATPVTTVASRASTATTASVRTAERNLSTPVGEFNVRLRQSPSDPRTGEEVQFEIAVRERVEGGFGAGDLQPVEGARVTARVVRASGEQVVGGLEAHGESQPYIYGVHHAFADGGDYKLVFDVRTAEGREFAVDFPASISTAPINWAFWLGLTALSLVSAGAVLGYGYSRNYYAAAKGDAVRKNLLVGIGALVFFISGTAALAYLQPPRERRAVTGLPPEQDASASNSVPATGDAGLGGSGALITIGKESQLLFSIRTAVVEERQIVSGLKATGTVRARPDAQGIISPPVSGRIKFNRNISVGAIVGRDQIIGSIEQVLGAPEQASLEAQRISLRAAALEQQSRATEQQSLAAQARTRLTQAQRELQRAKNLLEVGAAPRRRVEEAQTAVRLAEQEVASAEEQARVAMQQARFSNESVGRVAPVREFPLRSPVTGVVTNLNAATGQQVEAGAELASVINLTTVLLEAQIFERDLAAARESGRATYTAPALNGEVYRIGAGDNSDGGRLVSIGQSVDPQTRTVPVIFEVPNPLNRLREGMFVEITLDTSGGARVLTVPKESVITEQGRT